MPVPFSYIPNYNSVAIGPANTLIPDPLNHHFAVTIQNIPAALYVEVRNNMLDPKFDSITLYGSSDPEETPLDEMVFTSIGTKEVAPDYSVLKDGVFQPAEAGVREIIIMVTSPFINTAEEWETWYNTPGSLTVWQSLFYFPINMIYLYLSPQQLQQFEYMAPGVTNQAYTAAIGKLTANIGNRFDMATILNETDEAKKDDTIRWILSVLTAYNIATPSLNVSQPLSEAYEEVSRVVQQLKGGSVSLEEPAPYRKDEYDANISIVSKRSQYLG